MTIWNKFDILQNIIERILNHFSLWINVLRKQAKQVGNIFYSITFYSYINNFTLVVMCISLQCVRP